jgi:hypothetical protein
MKRMNMIKYQHRIGGYLTEFHSFVEYVFLQRCIRKRGGDIMNVRLKTIFSGETKSRRIHKTREATSTKVGPTCHRGRSADLACRSADLAWAHLSVSSSHNPPPPLRFYLVYCFKLV